MKRMIMAGALAAAILPLIAVGTGTASAAALPTSIVVFPGAGQAGTPVGPLTGEWTYSTKPPVIYIQGGDQLQANAGKDWDYLISESGTHPVVQLTVFNWLHDGKTLPEADLGVYGSMAVEGSSYTPRCLLWIAGAVGYYIAYANGNWTYLDSADPANINATCNPS